MRGQRGLPYVRAIDGVRAFAVVSVLAFHGGVPGARGGFLGVSLFFTLSGYLITQLLLREHDMTGRVSLRSFWARRLRRLAPASLVCLAAVAVVGALTDVFPGRSVRGDIVAALADVANWRFAFAKSSYADIFAAKPSPVAHFWSLAIEEQFYLVFPVLVVAVLVHLGRRALPFVLVVLVALCTLAARASPANVVYYGSYSRAPELVTGALLALALPFERSVGERAARAVAGGGVLAAAGLLGLVATTEVTDGWLYRGGFPAISLLSCAVLAATTVPGFVRTACSWRPAVTVGRCSYGLYVYHWPIYLLLTRERLGLAGPALFAVRIFATSLVAIASLVLLEGPIRRRKLLTRAPNARHILAAGLASVLVIVTLTPAANGAAPIPGVAKAAGVVSFSRPERTKTRKLDVLVLGTAPQVTDWVRNAPVAGTRLAVRSAVRPGCPVLLPDRDEGACPSFARAANLAFAKATPDLVVVGIGAAERTPIAEKVARGSSAAPDERLRLTKEALATSGYLVAAMLKPLPDGPVLFVDTAPSAGADPLAFKLREATLQRHSVIVSRAHDAGDLASAMTRLTARSSARRLRVLVIGDSTSYQLADGLDAVAGDRLEVEWAGSQNCGIVALEKVRWWPGAEFDRADCPSPTAVWPEVVTRFRPDVVLAVASLPELSDQRYEGQDRWVKPGEPAYIETHDAGMSDLQSLLSASGALTLVATIPPLHKVDGSHGDTLGNPARLSAWLGQIHRWDRSWRSVGVLDWATMVRDAERSAGRSLRVDIVHLDPHELVSILGRRLVRELLAATEALRADARHSGCLIGSGAAAHLDLARCAGA